MPEVWSYLRRGRRISERVPTVRALPSRCARAMSTKRLLGILVSVDGEMCRLNAAWGAAGMAEAKRWSRLLVVRARVYMKLVRR